MNVLFPTAFSKQNCANKSIFVINATSRKVWHLSHGGSAVEFHETCNAGKIFLRKSARFDFKPWHFQRAIGS